MPTLILLILVSAFTLSCPTAALAVTSGNDLLMQQVMQQMYQENYEEALALLNQSWQKGPRTANKAFLLGKVNRRLLRYPEARRYLEEAVRLQPGYAEAQLLLADTLIALDKPGEAEPHLRAVQAAGFEPGQTAFLQGMAASKQKNFSQAVEHFRRAQKDPKLAQEAKFQESMALASLNRYSDAHRTMKEAISLNPRSQTATLAQGYVQALELRLQDVRRFRFSAAAGFDWDSNVTLQPGDPVSAQQVSGQGDLVYTQLANFEYNFVPSGSWALWGTYSYYQNFHRRLTKFDMWSNTLGLTPMYTWSNSRFWLPFTYNYSDVESDKYYTAFTLTPSYLYLIGQKWGIEGNLRLARQYYWFPTLFPQDDRSGRNIATSLAGYYFFKNQQGFVQLRFTYEHFFTSGSNWENDTYRFSLSALYPFTDKFKVRGFMDLAFQPYTDNFYSGNPAVVNPKRDDTILMLGVEGTYNLWKGLEINAHYYFIRDSSNIAIYDYTRHIMGGQLGYRY
jgi:tetratricopeptide (TPR) repeat protein